jgi:superfamily II DNA or RNA helicase
MDRNIAPGARVTIRDEDWIVRRIDLCDDGGHALTCDGLSELVRGTSAIFLDRLEDEIAVHDPASTRLFQDESPYFGQALLYLESQRLRTVANDQQMHRAHQAAMQSADYQRVPAEKGLKQVRTRILIADGVGLGKTLEAGMLATELDIRGRGRRILVVTQKSMLTQFQKEWWSRFTIPLVRLDSAGIQRIRNKIPSGHNPFNYFDKTIISMDTLKGNNEYRNYLEKSRWDIIVIDECHNVAVRKGDAGSSQRARLAKNLATKSDTLILLSATPHDGSANSFASLIWLLDPTAISDPDDYTRADLDRKDLFVRRFKKDIKAQAQGQFLEPITRRLSARATPEEETAYQAVLEIPFTQKGEHQAGKPSELQRVGLQKALFSSPAAADAYARHRIDKLARKPIPTPAEDAEVAALQTLRQALARITPERFSKYQRLIKALRDPDARWSGTDTADRLVIFSERIETLKWLMANLPGDLRLKVDAFRVLDGSLSDIDQQEIVERFGQQHRPCIDGVPLVMFDGDFTEGDSQAIIDAVRENGAAALFLDSEGGLESEALMVGYFLRSNNVDAIAGEVCASARTFGLAGGVERFALETSRIGIHRSQLTEGAGTLENGQQLTANYIRYFRSMDVDPELVAIAGRVPSERVHWLTPGQARNLNLVNETIRGGD